MNGLSGQVERRSWSARWSRSPPTRRAARGPWRSSGRRRPTRAGHPHHQPDLLEVGPAAPVAGRERVEVGAERHPLLGLDDGSRGRSEMLPYSPRCSSDLERPRPRRRPASPTRGTSGCAVESLSSSSSSSSLLASTRHRAPMAPEMPPTYSGRMSSSWSGRRMVRATMRCPASGSAATDRRSRLPRRCQSRVVLSAIRAVRFGLPRYQ